MTRYIPLLILPLFFLACARQTSPTGGPKDTIPPVLIRELSTPRHESINFKGNKITLQFDEDVAVNNPKEQIIIIPDIGKDYEISARKQTVTINLKSKLLDSTTYSLNFREAIQDITEKNTPENLKLAFSTGHYIDSLSISGKATSAQKKEDLKEITVAIYQSDTFNILKHKPIYITKSDKTGNFSLENLKPGNYFLYAFEDKNRNLIVDTKNEMYAFLSDTIKLITPIKKIDLELFKLDLRPLKLTSARPYNTYFNIKTGKNLVSYKLKSVQAPIISSFGEDQSNIKIYNTFNQDSLLVSFNATDSANNTIDTTLYIKFSQRDVRPEAFTHQSLGSRVISEKGILKSRIKFSKPLLSITFDSIYYAIDSTTNIPITKEDVKWDSIHNILSIEKKFDKNLLKEPEEIKTSDAEKNTAPKPIYQFVLRKGSFISIESDSSNLIQETVKPLTLESTGIIIVQVDIKVPNFIIQLRDKSFNILETKVNTRKVEFEDLVPGDYLISVVIDSDSNGEWSLGNLLLNQEPEKIIYYKNEKKNSLINLKANFELGPLLITD
ncbi:MAG TPA: Ig-like domain-containing domain [Ohtaekwangia sp.]